ncbi:MAG: TonB-dependent receptor [Verrucomicrobia bacterium]|nr:TonB-dependent receptor [Verrucomicrobiota bacterium]
MSRQTKVKKDRTSLLIAVILHVVVILGVGYWAWKTGKLEEMARRALEFVRAEKKETKKDDAKPVQQKTAPPPKLPPINQGVGPSTASSGTRRAVATDAPEAHGETFFTDTRRQTTGSSAGGGSGSGGATSAPPKVAAAPKVGPSKPSFAPPPKTTIKQLLMERAKEAASTEAFGSEQISKSGVSDAGAIVNKVAGASIVDGRFAVIRGLSDRYVTTTFNGGEIPSADPYRRSASLDLFPAQIIEKVVVAKTFTPDQQGAFTGGGINIVSKSFPERPFANVSVGGAYNTKATGNDKFLTYKGGGLDWLGMDDGSRALPQRLNDLSVRPPAPVFTTGPRTRPEYQANIQAADSLNDLTKLLGPAQFAPTHEAPPLNHNFAVAAGDTTHLLGRPLGVFGSLSYKRDFTFYDDGISRRYKPTTGGAFEISKDNRDALAVDTVNWSGMTTLAYQLLDDHDVSFNFLYNQNGIDYGRQQVGTQETDPGATIYQNRLQFTERSLNTFQLRGTDRFPTLGDLKLDWLAALSDTSQDEPDVRFFNYKQDGGAFATSASGLPDPGDPTRYFRTLEEQNRNLKLDLTIPFRQWRDEEGQLKLGVFDSLSERSFQERGFYYKDILGGFDGDPNNYLRSDNLGYTNLRTNNSNGRIAYDWLRYVQTYDSFYDGKSAVQAAYFMLDFPVVNRVRLVGGLRLETTDLTVDSYSDLPSVWTGLRENHSKIEQTDLLPAAGLIYAARTNMNIRLHYSQTVARPSFRELAAYRSYDPFLDVLLDGNPNLTMSASENYDLRWEWFPRAGELLSVSLFYKKIQGAIERIALDNLADNISFINREASTVMGVEFEARKTLDFLDANLRYWSLGGNFSYIQSETSLTVAEYGNKLKYVPGASQNRPLYDQSPYILNLDLSYDNPRSGTSASLILNAAGPRISIASPIAEDVYEHPPLTLDLVLSQKLSRNMTMKFTARNLLDPEIKRTYGENSNFIYSSCRRGMTFGLSLSYDF